MQHRVIMAKGMRWNGVRMEVTMSVNEQMDGYLVKLCREEQGHMLPVQSEVVDTEMQASLAFQQYRTMMKEMLQCQ